MGINGTRLFTTLYGGKTLNIGWVMTPTLALLAEREIAEFQKEKYHAVELDCGAAGKDGEAPEAVRPYRPAAGSKQDFRLHCPTVNMKIDFIGKARKANC